MDSMAIGPKNVAKARRDGFTLLLLGALGFIAINSILVLATRQSPYTFIDFRAAYVGGRSILKGLDPYNHEIFLRVFRESLGNLTNDASGDYVRQVVTLYFYPPTIFAVTAPFATLPFAIAQALWVGCSAAFCILSTFLAWDLAAQRASFLAGALLSFCLVNSISSIFWGNPAGLAVGLCVIAVWCIFRERFTVLGVLCLAISLALKPNDSGLVWLYLFFAGPPYRKRAMQTLAALAIYIFPFVLWVCRVSPHWPEEMRTNYLVLSAHGTISDPGPSAALSRGASMLTDLRSVFSFFWDDPHFYNLASFTVIAVLLIVWIREFHRAELTSARAWFHLAAVAALSPLASYHRIYDARLIVLTIPALALLWTDGGRIARIALLINGAAIIATSDLPWVLYLFTMAKLDPAPTGMFKQLRIACVSLTVPLTLLATAVIYLWALMRDRRRPIFPEMLDEPKQLA